MPKILLLHKRGHLLNHVDVNSHKSLKYHCANRLAQDMLRLAGQAN